MNQTTTKAAATTPAASATTDTENPTTYKLATVLSNCSVANPFQVGEIRHFAAVSMKTTYGRQYVGTFPGLKTC